MISLPVI